MKRKLIAAASITVVICLVLGNGIACTTPVTEYVLTISSTEGGNVTRPGEGKYPLCEEQGRRVDLAATPDAGYQFVNWTGDVGTIADVNDPTTTITVDHDYSIIANFTKEDCLLTIEIEGEGNVTPFGAGSHWVACGITYHLKAVAAPGWHFHKWSGDATGFDAKTDITPTRNKPCLGHCRVTAHFRKSQQ